MRSLFLIGGKLLGIFLTYQGLLHAASAISMADGRAGVAVMYALYVVLSLGIGLVLAFRTERLAALLGVEPDPQAVSGLTAGEALRTGIILIGLYVLVTRIGHLVSLTSFAVAGNVAGSSAALVRELIAILVAVLFVVRSGAVVRLVERLSAGSLELVPGDARRS